MPQGKNAVFQCHSSTTFPSPTITWFKNSRTLNIDGSRIRVSPDTGTLLIRSVTRLDEGSYYCVGRNSAGSVRSSIAFLSIDFSTGVGT